jgi:hypothetical protein
LNFLQAVLVIFAFSFSLSFSLSHSSFHPKASEAAEIFSFFSNKVLIIIHSDSLSFEREFYYQNEKQKKQKQKQQ